MENTLQDVFCFLPDFYVNSLLYSKTTESVNKNCTSLNYSIFPDGLLRGFFSIKTCKLIIKDLFFEITNNIFILQYLPKLLEFKKI